MTDLSTAIVYSFGLHFIRITMFIF